MFVTDPNTPQPGDKAQPISYEDRVEREAFYNNGRQAASNPVWIQGPGLENSRPRPFTGRETPNNGSDT